MIEEMAWYIAFYHACLVILGISCVAVLIYRYRHGPGSAGSTPNPEFAAFQRQYLTVYLLCTFSDWLKGPYVYALYEEYGFNSFQIAWLFAGGFLSSLIFGTVAGAISDLWGRKFMAITFCAVYALSALTKIVNSFAVLMLGRILSGVATSLLFTTFEAWMVAEHRYRNFPEALLTNTFSKATLGNGIAAVVAGIVAQTAASCCGYAAPFLVAIPCLAAASLFMIPWRENYGNQQIKPIETLLQAASAIRNDKSLIYLGLCQSIFEASMYLWVFYWTPSVATSEAKQHIPYGILFACFMAALMIGGTIPEAAGGLPAIFSVAIPLHAVCGLALAVAAAFFHQKAVIFLSFVVFEGCVGVYFPTHGSLRSVHVPEETRAAVMSLYRLPMNLMVVAVLNLGLRAQSVLALLCVGQLIALQALRKFRQSVELSGSP